MGRRFSRLFGPDARRDVDDELAFHVEMRITERIAAGDDPDSARAYVNERLGNIDAAREECVDINRRRGRRLKRADYMSELRQDIGYALRALRRRPGFAVVAVTTLALGIGANTAIFSVVNGVLLTPLPYAAADQLAIVKTEYSNGTAYPLSAPDFMSVREDTRVFTDVGAYYSPMATLTERGEPREIQITFVTKELFATLGLRAPVGRLFSEDDHVPGATGVAVVTEGFARREFGSVGEALDQVLVLNGVSVTVVGVLPAGTETPEQTQLYRPLPYGESYSASTQTGRRSEFLTVVGRLRPGATRALLLQDVRRIGLSLQERFPDTNQNLTFTSMPLSEMVVGDVRTPLLILLGAVGLVLLIACANVANLLLARATAREGELAVRAALGAGRGRLVRQLLTESIVLAFAGAAIGLLIAWLGTRALLAAQPADLPRLNDIRIDGAVMLFTAAIAITTGLLFGVLPAAQATGSRMMQSLREGGRGALSGVRGQRIRATLVMAELALAVMLLVGAGLLIRSFVGMTRVDSGFHADHAIAFRVSLQGAAYGEPETREQFFTQLEERLQSIPGVTGIGATSALPMTGNAAIFGPFAVENEDVPPGILPEIRYVTVTPGYFEVLGAPLLMGRPLDGRDREGAPLVALFNHAAIARWFPDGQPVGRRVQLGGDSYEVVGIVGDVLQRAPGVAVEPEMYVPYAQNRSRTMRYVVRGAGDMASIAGRIPTEVHSLDPRLPIESVDPLARVFADAVARPRLYTMLLTVFAGVALALAVVGVFGVMSYVVAQRRREISIRMALGANAGSVIGMIVWSAMRIALAGLALGVAAALAGGRVLRSQLFGVEVADPVTIAGVVAFLVASAGLATLLPAVRAARLDPGSVLRDG